MGGVGRRGWVSVSGLVLVGGYLNVLVVEGFKCVCVCVCFGGFNQLNIS